MKKPRHRRQKTRQFGMDSLECRQMFAGITAADFFDSPFAQRGFNPQPEPPAAIIVSESFDSGIARISFNPQPEPPTNAFFR